MRVFKVAVCLLACLTACAHRGAECPRREPPPLAANVAVNPTADPLPASRLAPELLARIGDTRLLDHVKLQIDKTGLLQEVSIYHNDPAPIGAPVKDLVAQQFPGSHVIAYESEWEGDVGSASEVEVKTEQGRLCELSATRDGALRFIACDLQPKELSAEVSTAVQRILPGAQVQRVEFREDKTGDRLTIHARIGTQVHLLHMTPKGELLKQQTVVPATLLIEF